MSPRMVYRIGVERALIAARQHAWELQPYSPAWDAVMARVEDLERTLWRLDLAAADEPDESNVNGAVSPGAAA